MSIKSLMSTNLVTINAYDTLGAVKDIFELVTFHHILVLEHQKLVGIISDRDYLKVVSPKLGTVLETEKDIMPLNKKAHQIMSRNVISVKENASVLEVVECFERHAVSCVPVINLDNEPIGIISWRDVMSALADNLNKKQHSKENQ